MKDSLPKGLRRVLIDILGEPNGTSVNCRYYVSTDQKYTPELQADLERSKLPGCRLGKTALGGYAVIVVSQAVLARFSREEWGPAMQKVASQAVQAAHGGGQQRARAEIAIEDAREVLPWIEQLNDFFCPHDRSIHLSEHNGHPNFCCSPSVYLELRKVWESLIPDDIHRKRPDASAVTGADGHSKIIYFPVEKC